MPLWTDVIDPVEATGIARVELEEWERQNGTLARYLPNVQTLGDTVEFWVDGDALVAPAKYRAFNSPPEIGGGGQGQKKVISLPAISRNEPIDEKTQRALKSLPDDRVKKSLVAAIKRNIWAVGDRNEATRGILFDTGDVVVSAGNFIINDLFNRDAALKNVTVGAAGYWSDKTVDRLAQLNTYADLYASKNMNQRPGAIVMSRAAWNAFASGNQFATQLIGGAQRPGLADEVRGFVASADLPMIDIYDRSTALGRILPANKIYFAPAPVDPNAEDPTRFGATYYGESLMADAEGFDGTGDEPGAIVGVYKEDRIPFTVEAQIDAITMPVAHNPNAVYGVQVLA